MAFGSMTRAPVAPAVAAIARRAREQRDAEIAQACQVRELAIYGSLGEAVRAFAHTAD
jgi:hypothetical protein